MAGAANIIRMYSRDMTNTQVPAVVSIFFRGFRPRLAMKQPRSRMAKVASCTYRVGMES